MPIPVIDLFAGPGGLSEGFEGYTGKGARVFECALSVEKEPNAHKTLLLRAFVRLFKNPPKEYYEYLRGEIALADLYQEYPEQFEVATTKAIRLTLEYRNRDRVDRLIRKALRNRSQKWVLIGGPPCQAYSLVGRARRNREDRRQFERDGRHFLYKEYLRIVRKFRPPVFVMENVKGLLSSSAKGVQIFDRMLEDFASAGYTIHSFVKKGAGDELTPTDYVIDSESFDIPQRRHRVIILGVRRPLERGTRCIRTKDRQVTIHAAIGDLPKIRSQTSPPSTDSYESWEKELRKLRSAFRRDGQLKHLPRGQLRKLSVGARFLRRRLSPTPRSSWIVRHQKWLLDRRIEGVTLHESRHHMPSDLRRYLYASLHAKANGQSPRIKSFPAWLRPAHENVGKAVTEALFSDRFRVQVKNKPSTTVVSHISKDGHYYIHYDPRQCRSLTVREAARLQTFPDNYQFQGTRTRQYQQVGNAVPPLLARQLAAVVNGILKQI
jgi:DNA (cytosine-5)-methyltransferase 1